MLMQQSMIHRKYHGENGYLLGNIDAEIQEFVGMGHCVDNGQTTQTDKLQMMMSCQSSTSQSHKQIAQTNHTKLDERHVQMMLSDAPEQLRSIWRT